MKAKASWGRTHEQCRFMGDVASAAALAKSEACAILAESEPTMVVQTSNGPMLAGAGFLPPCTDSWLKGSEWGAALAESLAQFIAA
jgi:hypothetical protein